MLASISIDLTANAVAYFGIEHVTLTGSAALNAAGNASSNMLIGNSGANHLDGAGGPDTMLGGAGNDVYVVDDSADQAIDELNGGIDQVNSSAVAFTLGFGVENLTLAGIAAGGRQRFRQQDHRQRSRQLPVRRGWQRYSDRRRQRR